MKTAYNIWGPEHRLLVDPVFQQRVRDGNVPGKNQAALRSAIYKEFFDQLDEDEQREWTERAEREHQQALANIEKGLQSGPSTTPEARQRYAAARSSTYSLIKLIWPYSGL